MRTDNDESQVPTWALSFGGKAVGKSFNPSGSNSVDVIKGLYADVIDFLNNMRNEATATPEIKRLCSVAITEAQWAQMWAVKAITWKD